MLRWVSSLVAISCCVACSSTATNEDPTPASDGGVNDATNDTSTSCDNIAGSWSVTACSVSGQCTIAQSGCAITVSCTALWVLSGTGTGTVEGDQLVIPLEGGACVIGLLPSKMEGDCTVGNPEAGADAGTYCKIDGQKN